MAAGAFVFPSPQRLNAWGSSDLMHSFALRAVSVVWVIAVLLMRPNPFVSLRDIRHLLLPLMLIPLITLYCMNFQFARWHGRLGEQPFVWAFRWMAWVFPIVLILYATPFARGSYAQFILFEMPQLRAVIRWGAPALFFVNAFLLGVTWYGAVLATREPPSRDVKTQ
jgi:hypothetical protein